jgi:ATP-dependent RNA helicase DDX23/PRP28
MRGDGGRAAAVRAGEPARAPAGSVKRPRSPADFRTPREGGDRAAIRRHYMREADGAAGNRQFSRQQHEKTRFKFEWDAEDDTNLGADDAVYAELRAKSFAAGVRPPGRPAGADGNAASRATGTSRANGGGARGDQRQPRRGNAGGASVHDVRHWSEKGREEMTDRDWAIFREDHAITLRGGTRDAAKPARSWEETGLPHDILRLVRNVGYSKPSPIQMAAIPVGLRRRDLIGLAETGSGKTAAFVLPMLVHIRSLPVLGHQIALDGPYALVLAPTRELVLQIEAETRKFAAPLGYRVTAVIGGQGLEEQGLALQSGCEIVVCTPGRMGDLLSRRLAVLTNCNYLILDEADRMIDMGFEPQVQEILGAMPAVRRTSEGADAPATDGARREPPAEASRQTVMFSATMSPAVERLARDYLVKPTIVTIGEAGKAAEAVDQRVEFLTSEGKKRERLVKLVRELDPPVIVFVNTKKGCEDVARLIESGCGLRPSVLHSGKSQDQREQILDGFKAGRVGALVATDLLGRGIDIKGVNHVVNFELPGELSKYTHRIGRTGRAGRKGIAWSLATSADADLFGDLKSYLEQSGSRVPPAIARLTGGRSNMRNIID